MGWRGRLDGLLGNGWSLFGYDGALLSWKLYGMIPRSQIIFVVHHDRAILPVKWCGATAPVVLFDNPHPTNIRPRTGGSLPMDKER